MTGQAVRAHRRNDWTDSPPICTRPAADRCHDPRLDLAAATITTLLARTLSAGEPTPAHLHVASIISDIWLANLLAVVSGRLSAADARDRIDRATRRVVDRATRHPQTP
ncbi:hypothetical protein [Mycobacteroides abscessus]|uniref:hypothetical protein n=1 Tax=Mycobacteroides abscessus TaxID=36809 RepID=UPI00373FD64E